MRRTPRDVPARTPGEYYPPTEPFRHGYLDVPGGHRVYWEECGNPLGRPIVYLHGGPGIGCDTDDRRYFDPAKWRIILLDQRGCGRSTPPCHVEGKVANLASNTTNELIEDIRQLLVELEVRQTVLFGGSWGSTLALAYAIRYPDTVSGMVLRGVFLGTKAENKSYFGGDVAQCCPEVWDRFISYVPSIFQDEPARHYLKIMMQGTPAVREEYAYEWARYEDALLRLDIPDEADLDRLTRSYDFQTVALLEAWYLANNCFFEEGHIMNYLGRLPIVPIQIVQGRYDLVCPPVNAYRLYQKMQALGLPVTLRMVTAGHSALQPSICRELILATQALYEQL